MTQNLIEKIRKARETVVEVGNIKLTVRRPTHMEMLDMRGRAVPQSELITRFVTDWSGVREIDLVPGGTPDLVPFSPELFAEWAADHPESWSGIVTAVVDGYKAHEAKLGEDKKN